MSEMGWKADIVAGIMMRLQEGGLCWKDDSGTPSLVLHQAQDAFSNAGAAGEAANHFDGGIGITSDAFKAGVGAISVIEVALGTVERIQEGNSGPAAFVGSVTEAAVGDSIQAAGVFVGSAAGEVVDPLGGGLPGAAAGVILGTVYDNGLGVSEKVGDAVDNPIDGVPAYFEYFKENVRNFGRGFLDWAYPNRIRWSF